MLGGVEDQGHLGGSGRAVQWRAQLGRSQDQQRCGDVAHSKAASAARSRPSSPRRTGRTRSHIGCRLCRSGRGVPDRVDDRGRREQARQVLRLSRARSCDSPTACRSGAGADTWTGSWRATPDGLFVDHVSGGSGACYHGPGSVPGWLRLAAGHRADGPDRLLVDREGDTVARLVPGGRPKVDADTAPSEGEPPVLTDELRRMLSPAAPLPGGLQPAAAADLVGRWVPSDPAGTRAPQPPFVQLAADGGWTGSDGCNGQGGRSAATNSSRSRTSSAETSKRLTMTDGGPLERRKP
jgi:hypothetical protein